MNENAVKGLMILLALIMLILVIPQLNHWFRGRSLDRAASDLKTMRKQLEARRAKERNRDMKKYAKRFTKQIRECADELRRYGKVSTTESYVADWYRSRGYEVDSDPNFGTTRYTIGVPPITTKELSDIIVK